MRQEVKECFERDIKHHLMTVRMDQGMHRDLRFGQKGSSIQYFNLTTWPGHLSISGDMGCFVFSRIPDMFDFFRTPSGRINPRYWAEKVQTGRDSVEAFSEEAFIEALRYDIENHWSLDDLIEEIEPDYPDDYDDEAGLLPSTWVWHPQSESVGTLASWRTQQVDPDETRGPFETEEAARADLIQAVWEEVKEVIPFYDGEHEAFSKALGFKSELTGGDFSDFWEVSCKEYTLPFLWCLHAIVWGINEYDRYKRAQTPSYRISLAA